jgi:N-acetylmuramoyl-L-alanine amidase
VKYRPMDRVDFLVVHGFDTPAPEKVGAADIRHRHRSQGWRDIGYHYVIRRSGEIEFGRDDWKPGAHEPRVNRRSLGVCLVGSAPYPGEQLAGLRRLLARLKISLPDAEVIGHGDVPNVRKACPGFDVRSWWAEPQE